MLFLQVLTDNGYKTDYYDKNYPGLIIAIQLRRKLNYHLVRIAQQKYQIDREDFVNCSQL